MISLGVESTTVVRSEYMYYKYSPCPKLLTSVGLWRNLSSFFSTISFSTELSVYSYKMWYVMIRQRPT